MINQIILLFLLTFIPFLELRFSIPIGILSGTVQLPFGLSISGLGMNWIIVMITCIIANAVLGILIYWGLDIFTKYLVKYKFFRKPYEYFVKKSQKKIEKYVQKYGPIGVALFIAVPLPGTGSYAAALGSYVLGLDKKKFAWANLIGVTIAGILVTLITLTGKGLFELIFG